MSERIKFVIHPSSGEHAMLSVEDAVRQILDIVKLASAEAADEEKLDWQLIYATTNSPLSIEVEAFGKEGGNIDAVAQYAKASFAKKLLEIDDGHIPEAWASGPLNAHAKALFKRNTNGIGLTDIIFTDTQAIKITHSFAEKAAWLLEKPRETADKTHTEIGSIDAYLIEVGAHYNEPAIKVRNRLTGALLWCRVTESERDAISESTKLADVWEHRRVRIHGRISYDRQGNISSIKATKVVPQSGKATDVTSIYDEKFTGEASPEDYLHGLREGKIA